MTRKIQKRAPRHKVIVSEDAHRSHAFHDRGLIDRRFCFILGLKEKDLAHLFTRIGPAVEKDEAAEHCPGL